MIPRLSVTAKIDPSQLQGNAARASDLTPAWIESVQPIVTAFFQRRFDSEGASDGQPRWAPLASSTLRNRRRAGRGRGGIGRDTNRLWASFVKSAGSTPAPGGVLAITPSTYERGSVVPYAGFFSGGTRRQPARPIVPAVLPDSLVTDVTAALTAYIRGAA